MTFTGGDSINLNNLPTFRINYEVIDTTSLRINVRRLFGRDGEDLYTDKEVRFGEELPLGEWGTVQFRFWEEAKSRFKGGSYDYFMSGSHYIMLYSPQMRARELSRQIGVDVMEAGFAVASPGDIILTVGAGDVYKIGENLVGN